MLLDLQCLPRPMFCAMRLTQLSNTSKYMQNNKQVYVRFYSLNLKLNMTYSTMRDEKHPSSVDTLNLSVPDPSSELPPRSEPQISGYS